MCSLAAGCGAVMQSDCCSNRPTNTPSNPALLGYTASGEAGAAAAPKS